MARIAGVENENIDWVKESVVMAEEAAMLGGTRLAIAIPKGTNFNVRNHATGESRDIDAETFYMGLLAVYGNNPRLMSLTSRPLVGSEVFYDSIPIAELVDRDSGLILNGTKLPMFHHPIWFFDQVTEGVN